MSAESARRHMPEVATAVLTDVPERAPYFDRCLTSNRPWRGLIDKPNAMQCSPFERTIFADTDTYFCAPVTELFGVLDRYDLAFTQAPWRLVAKQLARVRWPDGGESMPPSVRPLAALPDWFVGANTGLLLFRRTPPVQALFRAWEAAAERLAMLADVLPINDQASFTEVLFSSSATFLTLPPEYNLRFIYPSFAADRVKVLHGRAPALESVYGRTTAMELIAARLNADLGPRVFSPEVLTRPSRRADL